MVDNEWWGYSPRHGWVLIERTNPCNRPGGSRYDPLVFVRCSDWTEFTEPRINWVPPAYDYAPVHLKKLKGDTFKDEHERYERLRSEWPARKAQLVQRKQEEDKRLREEGERKRKQRLDLENQTRKAEQEEIKTFVLDREIISLIHFTRIENLDSILEHGLMARTVAARESIPIVVNDQQRFDGHLDAINVSISFPNYKMFFRKRQNDRENDWVVLCIRPDILWELGCSFYTGNAADTVSRESLRGRSVDRLAEMFAEEAANSKGETVLRKNLGIPKCFTTDPQAEVLVSERIDTQYIFGICFSRRDLKNIWEPKLARRQSLPEIYEYDNYFGPRSDYEYWPSK